MKLVKIALVCSSLLVVAGASAQLKGDEIVKNPKYICVACHTVDTKLVGPSFKEIAKFYKNDKKKADEVAKKIKAGSAGVFPADKGGGVMPANPVISEAEAKVVAEYILGLK